MSEYVQAAMWTAHYERVSSGGWIGMLPQFHLVTVWGETEEACYYPLQADLESAIEEAVRNRRPLPAFVGIATPTRDQPVSH